jgi:hypothetical protein
MYVLPAPPRVSVPSTSGRTYKDGCHTCRQHQQSGGFQNRFPAWEYQQDGSVFYGLARIGPRQSRGQRFRMTAIGDTRTVVAEQEVYKPPLFKPFISKVITCTPACISCITKHGALFLQV